MDGGGRGSIRKCEELEEGCIVTLNFRLRLRNEGQRTYPRRRNSQARSHICEKRPLRC